VPESALREPWRSFLRELDALVGEPTELHCLGGFVIVGLHDSARVTADVDVVEVRGAAPARLTAIAGKGSDLHRRHKVYLDIVTVASYPENYEQRLVPLFPVEFEHLRLMAFEVHDLVLAKLARNIDRDREDLRRLASHPGLDPDLLARRYHEEVRFQFGRPENGDVTLNLWLEMIGEVAASRSQGSGP
jgi:hypothetical protein